MHVDRSGSVLVTEAIQAVEIAEEEVLIRAYHELTQWHDRTQELPEPGKEVLVKLLSEQYMVDVYDPVSDRFLLENNIGMRVIAWREIHE